MSITDQPLSEVAIANMAVDVLDDYQLTSLTDDNAVARFMARNFGPVRDELLEMYPWTFAKGRAQLAVDENNPPAFGWKYSYRVPNDCLVPHQIRNRGEWNDSVVPYEFEGRNILTDYAPPLPLIYIKKITNPALFTPLFARAFAMKLAVYAAHNITGKAGYVDKANGLFNIAFENARLSETLKSGTPETQNRYDIIDVRGFGL